MSVQTTNKSRGRELVAGVLWAVWVIFMALPLIGGGIWAFSLVPSSEVELHDVWLLQDAGVWDRKDISLDGNTATISLSSFREMNPANPLILIDQNNHTGKLSVGYYALNPYKYGRLAAIDGYLTRWEPITEVGFGQKLNGYHVEGGRLKVWIDADLEHGKGISIFGPGEAFVLIGVGAIVASIVLACLFWPPRVLRWLDN
jgi:hypothetical protein